MVAGRLIGYGAGKLVDVLLGRWVGCDVLYGGSAGHRCLGAGACYRRWIRHTRRERRVVRRRYHSPQDACRPAWRRRAWGRVSCRPSMCSACCGRCAPCQACSVPCGLRCASIQRPWRQACLRRRISHNTWHRAASGVCALHLTADGEVPERPAFESQNGSIPLTILVFLVILVPDGSAVHACSQAALVYQTV